MKLREDVQKNRVWTHGSVYVDPNEFIPICPECYSDKVEKIPGHDTCAIYTCTDCGCKFDAWKGSERTKLGKAVEASLCVVSALMIIAAIASFIAGLIYGVKAGKSEEPIVMLKCIGISLGLPIGFLFMAGGADELRKSI